MADMSPITPPGVSEPVRNTGSVASLLQAGLEALESVLDLEAALQAAVSLVSYRRLLHRQEIAFERMERDLRAVANAGPDETGFHRLAYHCLKAATGTTPEETIAHAEAVTLFAATEGVDVEAIEAAMVVRASDLVDRVVQVFATPNPESHAPIC